MDNLSHSLIGLAAAKAGLEKLSPGATALCFLAANSPDSDLVTALFGDRWTYLHHHRGITHSIVGALALALALPLLFCLGDLLLAKLRKRPPAVKLKGLVVASIIVTATHPLMDWTNNYGVRPLLPWSGQWFYGDIAFVIDPIIWLSLGGAVFLLTSKSKKQIAIWLLLVLVPTVLVFFGPTNRGGLMNPTALRVTWVLALAAFVVLFKMDAGRRFGPKIPRVAFVWVCVYLIGLFFMHTIALRQAKSTAAEIAAQNSEQMVDVAAMPALANPFNWLCVLETERAAYKFNVSLVGNSQQTVVRHPRPETLNSEVMAQAINRRDSQVFLNFARFPVARIAGEDCATQTLVQFADLRYTEPGQSRGTFALEVPAECPALSE